MNKSESKKAHTKKVKSKLSELAGKPDGDGFRTVGGGDRPKGEDLYGEEKLEIGGLPGAETKNKTQEVAPGGIDYLKISTNGSKK